jgi:hypothetical protein
MNTNEVSGVLRTLDHAAQMSDRWLFLAALLVMGAGAVCLFRWLTGRFEAMNTRLTEVIVNNTAAINASKATMDDVKAEINFCRMRNTPRA